MNDLVLMRPSGLYCPAGDFYIDPAKPVARAVITHAHGDHARTGSMQYWSSREGEALLRVRIGQKTWINALEWGQPAQIGAARVSLHPAGHILGSAQVRIEAEGQVWVVSGDYKRDDDPTCTAFEPVPCDVFVTEATFGLPEYRWPLASETAREIHEWWTQNADEGQASVLFCYALGKAQRVLAELTRYSDRKVWLHGAMTELVEVYRKAGVKMLPTETAVAPPRTKDFAGELILAPPPARGTPWMKRFRPYRGGFASGWMQKDARREQFDRGFILSDHADWEGLLLSIGQSGAKRVLAMHGHTQTLVAHLRERGIDAAALPGAEPGY